MDRKKKIIEMIKAQGILPLFYHSDVEVSIQVIKALHKAGCQIIEYTNRGENAVKNFLEIRKFIDKEMPDIKIGVGTVRHKFEATEFINEGADFIVSPGVSREVADLVNKNDLLYVPGCFTPTEIIMADDWDAEIVKLFPANLLGPSFLSGMLELFPEIEFMPTGGVETSEEALGSWFKAGACAVGLGSKLVSKSLLESKNYESIESATSQMLQLVKKIKSS